MSEKNTKISSEVRAVQEVIDALDKLDEKVMQERVLRAAANLLGIDLLRPVIVKRPPEDS